MKVIANVKREPGEKNFSCYMNITELKTGVLGLGSSAKAAINDMMSGWQDAVADFKDDGIEAPELEIEYRFDVLRLCQHCWRGTRDWYQPFCHATIRDRHTQAKHRT